MQRLNDLESRVKLIENAPSSLNNNNNNNNQTEEPLIDVTPNDDLQF